jgi:hypothetical protein
MGLFEPLSRQASHNAMGPWFVRNLNRPFQPGCSYETLVKMIERGQVTKNVIVRGPTTRQFWTVAKRVPGIAHLLGYCHNCDASVDPGDHGCHACGVPFGAYLDRNFMGLPDVKPLPWEAPDIEHRQPQPNSRGIDWRRAAEPLGLSSFASDDELRSTAMGSSTPGGTGASPSRGFDPGGSRLTTPSPALVSSIGPSAVAMVETAAAATMTVTSVEPGVSTATTRAMRRRLDQQQRTIRMLTIGLIASAALALIVVMIVMASRGGSSPPIDNPKSQQASKLEPAPDDATSVASTLPATQADDQPAAASVDFSAEYHHAMELIDAAAKSDRSVDDRIKDLEQARTVLVHLAATVSVAQRPSDLDDRLKHVDAELDRLRLQKMFP